VPGPYNLKIQQADGTIYTQPMPLPASTPQPGATPGFVMSQIAPYDAQFNANTAGSLTGVTIAHAVNVGDPGTPTLSITISDDPDLNNGQPLAKASLISEFKALPDARGGAYALTFDKPVTLEKDHTYYLRFTSTGMISLIGSAPAEESSWDDGLPLRMGEYDPFGGIYQGDLNLEMYFDDNQDKFEPFRKHSGRGGLRLYQLRPAVGHHHPPAGALPADHDLLPATCWAARMTRMSPGVTTLPTRACSKENLVLNLSRLSPPTRSCLVTSLIHSSPRKPSPFTMRPRSDLQKDGYLR